MFSLHPYPRKARFGSGRTDLTDARWILVDPAFSPKLTTHFLRLAEELESRRDTLAHVTAGTPQTGSVLLRAGYDSSLPAQGYRLRIGTKSIELHGNDEPGIFYGIQTLRQLVRQNGMHLQQATITDWPDFAHRGVMLDISRCKVPTMTTLERLIDLFAHCKYNQLQLYTEHTFAFSAHETVWRDASPMTAAEILELDRYCSERYIELVPNLNSFGHFERWLRHPEYHHLADSPHGFTHPVTGPRPHGSVLKPNRQSLRFIESLYREFLPNFTSRTFNVGCDETWELGMGWSRNACKRRGRHRVYLDYLEGVEQLARKHGRRIQFWGDIVLEQPRMIRELPADVLALGWGYEADHPFNTECRHFANAGVEFYVCPGTSSWLSLTGRTTNCLGNLANAARNGLRHGARGYLVTDWGDNGHHQYLPISYPGLLAGADFCWCYRTNRTNDIAQGIDTHIVHDCAGVFGSLLLDLGRVLEQLPLRLKNKTVFNQLLFWDMKQPLPFFDKLTPASIDRCVEDFDQLQPRVADAHPETDDGDLLRREIAQSITMASHSLHRYQLFAGLRRDRAKLRKDLRKIVTTHQQLWLARNRPGGLEESTGKLTRVAVD